MTPASETSWSIAPVRHLLRWYPFLNGTGKIIDRSFLKGWTVDANTVVAMTRSGYPMRVFPNEMIGRNVYLAGRFDPTIAAVLASLVRPGDCFLDVGANIGVVSCELLHQNPDLNVLAVEPQPKVFEVLKENLSTFGDRARCVRVGMSDQSGVASMRVNLANLGGSGITTDSSPAADDDDFLSIELKTAPEILADAGLDRVDLVKIDVEGHQQQVLHSMLPVIQLHRPRGIVLEHEGDMSDPADPVRAMFDSLGYRVSGIAKRLNGWKAIDVDSAEGKGQSFNDYLAVPAESF